jgi:hypothetical protein
MGAVDDPAFADSTRSDEERRQPAPLLFDLKDVESFRYRVEDTLRAVTQSSVREFRGAELKREILNSAKLKAYFASNPGDLKVRLLFLFLSILLDSLPHTHPTRLFSIPFAIGPPARHFHRAPDQAKGASQARARLPHPLFDALSSLYRAEEAPPQSRRPGRDPY